MYGDNLKEALKTIAPFVKPSDELNMTEIQDKRLECIAFVLYLETWTSTGEDVSEFSAQTLKRLWAKWKEECLQGRTSEHHGDCTNIPTSCLRCHMDELFVNAQRILNEMTSQP